MTADFLVVLDACVLVPAPLRDTLLRFAEEPSLFVPRWSEEIIAETVRTLEGRLGWQTGHKSLMDNDPKDRHVLAAAVKCSAQVIVTYNKRHFPTHTVAPWGIEAQGRALS